MKYLEWLLIIVWTFIRKIIGVPITLAVAPFRGYANNVVFNYVIANKIYLKRLWERPIIEREDEYEIQPYHNTDGGKIAKRKISWLEYKIVYYILWQWMDADSNEDTFDKGYNNTIIFKQRYSWFPASFRKRLLKEQANVPYGNTFDLGDDRVTSMCYKPLSTLLWSIRNTAYNSKYMTHEKKEGDPGIWLVELGKWKFGWLQDANCPNNYSLVLFGW